MSSNNIDKQIIDNMRTHYSGLMKVGATDFGGDILSKTIFDQINTDKSDGLTQTEIDAAIPNLDLYIKKTIEKDEYSAKTYFGETYTKAAEKTDKNSDKTVTEQIFENKLNETVDLIFKYAQEHPEDATLQKYASKLKEIKDSGNLILTNIEMDGVVALAQKGADGIDSILVDNRDIENIELTDELLQTILHELRHTMENDSINSKAEEIKAEKVSIELANKILGKETDEIMLDLHLTDFIRSYKGYAEASPGTFNIPENTGIAVWYWPNEVTMDENNRLTIRSNSLRSLDGAVIEDHVQFGDQKDENGNPLPVSAQRIITDKNGNVIFSRDYGDYDPEKKSFDYFHMYTEQRGLKGDIEARRQLEAIQLEASQNKKEEIPEN